MGLRRVEKRGGKEKACTELIPGLIKGKEKNKELGLSYARDGGDP